MSLDGRFVAFRSNASDLVASDTNGADDVFVHQFELDTTAPKVVGVVPARGASGVSRAINLKATFSEPVYDVKKNFKLYPKDSNRPVGARVTPVGGTNNKVWVLNPNRRLRVGTLYTAKVGTGVEDKVGRALDQDRTKSRNQPMQWSFKTRR
jgi:Bacterial Ig-like domain